MAAPLVNGMTGKPMKNKAANQVGDFASQASVELRIICLDYATRHETSTCQAVNRAQIFEDYVRGERDE